LPDAREFWKEKAALSISEENKNHPYLEKKNSVIAFQAQNDEKNVIYDKFL